MKVVTPSRLLWLLALALPGLAWAEADITTGSGTLSATARLDFRIIVPKVLYFAVGTGSSSGVDNTNIDLVTFDYSTNPGDLGGGSSAVAGAITGNVVSVRALGNNGQITVSATTSGALGNGSGDTISWTEITAASDNADLPHPTIPTTGTGSSSNITISSGTKITTRSASWTYSYANSAMLPAGTYGTSSNNGRVTYTASMP